VCVCVCVLLTNTVVLEWSIFLSAHWCHLVEKTWNALWSHFSLIDVNKTEGSKLCPKWHPIPYIVHYFWPKPYGPWPNVVRCTGDRVSSGTLSILPIIGLGFSPLQLCKDPAPHREEMVPETPVCSEGEGISTHLMLCYSPVTYLI
jgi:hypothetical protein